MMWLAALAGCGGDDSGSTPEDMPDSGLDATPPKADAKLDSTAPDAKADADAGSMMTTPDATPDQATPTPDGSDGGVTPVPDASPDARPDATPDATLDTTTPVIDARPDTTVPGSDASDARVVDVIDAQPIIDVRNDTSDVTVIPPPPDATPEAGPVTLVSIAVTRPSASIANGTSEQFTATGTFADSSTQNLTGTVTWESLGTAVATIDTA
ncbi:MAG TPA: Ig-like domain-containing protein, partial [Polyangiaceae bacterium]